MSNSNSNYHVIPDLEFIPATRRHGPIHMFYILYQMENKSKNPRSITFLWGGGPGSATHFLTLGSIGPIRVPTQFSRIRPPPPTAWYANPYTLLSETDLVFIDAPDTGYSFIEETKGWNKNLNEAEIFSVQGDARIFSEFIQLFLVKYGYMNSPKYIFGESYGGLRVCMVAAFLQEKSIFLNGLILNSPILDYSTAYAGDMYTPPLFYVGTLPTMINLCWYYNPKLQKRFPDIFRMIQQTTYFASHDFLVALMQDDYYNSNVLKKLTYFTDFPASYWIKHRLRVNPDQFRRDVATAGTSDLITPLIAGRIDGTFTGYIPDSNSTYIDPSNPSLSSIFQVAVETYLRKELHFEPPKEQPLYLAVSSKALAKWTFRDPFAPWAPGFPMLPVNCIPLLRKVLLDNPFLQVFLADGLFDLACPFFLNLLVLSPLFADPLHQQQMHIFYYWCGHLDWLKDDTLMQLSKDLKGFIQYTLKVRDQYSNKGLIVHPAQGIDHTPFSQALARLNRQRESKKEKSHFYTTD